MFLWNYLLLMNLNLIYYKSLNGKLEVGNVKTYHTLTNLLIGLLSAALLASYSYLGQLYVKSKNVDRAPHIKAHYQNVIFNTENCSIINNHLMEQKYE